MGQPLDLGNTEREEYVRADVRNYRQLEKVFDKWDFDLVYHLAAEYGRWNGEDYYENLWETNAIGTKHMIRLQEKLGFKMVFFSSAEVYGDYEGVMTEDVMEKNLIRDTYQMNDYAITKWAGELMCMNSAKMFGTETVRVRPVNCYGPDEHYTPYRGFIPKFIYHALFDKPYVVYKGHKRIIDYVDDTCRTFANIVDNFIPGEVYNVGGRLEWGKEIKDYSDSVLKAVGKDDSIVTYKEAEPFTTKVKQMDFSKAVRDLKHDPQVTPEEGIRPEQHGMCHLHIIHHMFKSLYYVLFALTSPLSGSFSDGENHMSVGVITPTCRSKDVEDKSVAGNNSQKRVRDRFNLSRLCRAGDIRLL